MKFFAEMDEVVPADSIIASSSSGITMDVIQSACKRPQRCMIGHPFNPPASFRSRSMRRRARCTGPTAAIRLTATPLVARRSTP
jgi:3-hydroxyacyl-CoA dehydrogenase